jgi:maleate isomerase
MNKRTYRIGQIVPSSNITMETEVPLMLSRAVVPNDVTFTFHSSRAPMKNVSAPELAAMNGHMERCARELSDARMDIVASACLVAIMSQGPGYHKKTQAELEAVCHVEAPDTQVITSAGALVDSLKAIGAKRISFITPYMENLTELVAGYIENEGIKVKDTISLEIPNNLEVGAQDPNNLIEIVKRLDTSDVDAVVLSACVQMPSLSALAEVQKNFDVPVLSTAAATVFQILKTLKLPTVVPDAGELLSGKY